MSGVNVFIRADASRTMGTGHVMRCLSVAQALRDKGASVHFACRLLDGHLRDLISENGFGLVALPAPRSGIRDDGSDHSSELRTAWQDDATETIEAIEAIGALDFRPDWLIVDHYALDSRWEQCLRSSVGRVLVIDDLADRPHECDLLLDQNLYEDADTRYVGKVPEHCRLLLGPRYALLREEFRRAEATLRERPGSVKRIMVFFGGADAGGYTAVAIEALNKIELHDIEVDVVIGAHQPDRDAVEAACRDSGFVCHVQSSRMAELMSAADLAIGAGGSAHWERCCVGLPCVTFALAPNQEKLVHDGARAGLLYAPNTRPDDSDGIARHVRACIENPLLLEAMSRRAAAAVDGRGTQRLLRAMGVFSISLREAVQADCERVFEWRNHPKIREMSRDGAALDWPSHKAWYESVLSDRARQLLIGESAGQPVGVVRFDLSGDSAEISIYMVPEKSELGLGTELVLAAERWLSQSRSGLRCVTADVLQGNVRSHRLFRGAGYCVGATTTYTKRLQ